MHRCVLCKCVCVRKRSYHSTSVFVDGVNEGERRLECGSLCVCLCVIALNRSTERADKPYAMRCFGHWWKHCRDLMKSAHTHSQSFLSTEKALLYLIYDNKAKEMV